MSFTLRIPRRIQDALASWGIPQDTLRDFYPRAADDLESEGDAPARWRIATLDDELKLPVYSLGVPDFTDPDVRYEFFFRLEVHKDELRVVQCDCWSVSGDGDILWTRHALP